MISLYESLAISKGELITRVCSTADQPGRESWLWLPTSTCPDPTICLVAHIDTVWDDGARSARVWDEHGLGPWALPRMTPHRVKKKIYYDQRQQVYWSPNGLGADDRAGVYACMALREHTRCMVLLTDYEESGGSGAREAARIFKKELSGVRCFIELDRKGRGEMVFYNGESQNFRDFIGAFGFREKPGSFSDISILSRETGIVGVNLSAGYYQEHTVAEYLRVRDLNNTIKRVLKIITEGGVKNGRDKWKIAAPVCPELGGDNDARDIRVLSHRRRESSTLAGEWEV